MNIYQAVAVIVFLIAFPVWFILIEMTINEEDNEMFRVAITCMIMTALTICFAEGVVMAFKLFKYGEL